MSASSSSMTQSLRGSFSDLKRSRQEDLLLQGIQDLATKVVQSAPEDLARRVEELRTVVFSLATLEESYFKISDLRYIECGNCKDIQSLLSDDIAKLRREKEAGIGGLKHQIFRKKAKAELAFRLGIQPSKNLKGATNSWVLKDFKEKPLGILKEIEQPPPSGLRKLGHLFKKAFNFHRQVHFCREGGAVPPIYSDIAASKADEFFGFGFVPATDRVHFEEMGLDGSFMVWCHGHTEATYFSPSKEPATLAELKLFQRFAILDFFIGNLDRHLGNWLIVQDEHGHIISIKAIDNSNAFISANPTLQRSDIFVRKKQYLWREHPHAKFSFDEEMIEFMRGFSEERVFEFVQQLKEHFKEMQLEEGDRFLSEEVIAGMQERALLLKTLAEEHISPEQLATFRTEEAIREKLAQLQL